MDKIISVVYICDDNYTMPTCVSIQSIYENKKDSVYDIYVIGVELSEANKNLLKQINLSGINIKLLEVSNRYKNLKTNHIYVSKAALFKFELPNILDNLDKVLYIDSDTIILDDLKELFETDVNDFYAGVVRDYLAYYKRQDYVDINTSDYFNSGMMLLNLNKLRSLDISEKLLECKSSLKLTRYMDQDCFNIVFNENIKYLEPKFNYMTSSIYLYPNDTNPVIVHTTSAKKPWAHSYVPYFEDWYNMFKKSVCKNHKLKINRDFIYKEKIADKRIIHIGKFKISYKKIKKNIIDKYYKSFDCTGYSVKRLKDKSIEIKNKNLRIIGKANNTLWTAKEVLCNENYSFSIDEPYIMFDIGFNLGMSSLYFAQKSNIKAIYAFEPFTPTYELGMNNLKLNPELSKKNNLFNYGLGDCDKTLEIAYNPKLPGSMSTVEDKFADKNLVKEKLEVKNAFNVLEEIMTKHTEKVFVKLDAEGAEYEIIPLLSQKGLLKKIDVLIMEYHSYSDYKILLDILKNNGFFYFCTKDTFNQGIIRALRNSTISL